MLVNLNICNIMGHSTILHFRLCFENILLISVTLFVLDFLFAGWLYDATGQYDTSFYTAGAWILVSGLILLPLPASCMSQSEDTEQEPPIEEALI